MDKAARKRFLRIQKRKITNDRKDGEPESKKRAIGTFRKSLHGKESSDRNRERPEASGSLTSPEPSCYIKQLPPEVLAKIFSYSSSIPCYAWKSSSLRLVCKNWDDVYVHYTDAKVYFSRSVPSVHFENCGLRRLDIKFCDADLSKLPESMWQKIGCQVRSLELKLCKVGDHGWKNLITHCPNLRFLEVLLNGFGDARDLFCSPNMLKKLDITRENLESFKITSRQRSVDVANWIEIFEAFFKVFPNVTRYSAGCFIRSDCENFKFDFLKEADEKNFNAIATSLALSLSIDVNQQRKALDVASALRLKDISLREIRYAHEEPDKDVATLVKFFNNCNNFECIEMDLHWRIPDTILKSFFLQIARRCCKLRKLLFCDLEFSIDIGETLLQLRTICPSLEELCIKQFELKIKQSSLSIHKCYDISSGSLGRFLKNTMKIYPDLQHLDLRNSSCNDEMLQSIFKHLVNLKTLIVTLGNRTTNAGIIGNLISNEGGSNSHSGYSINNLKRLEKLDLFGYYSSRLDDTIFYKFHLPNLHHLEIDVPKHPLKFFPIVARSMPSLETIHFGCLFDYNILAWSPKISKIFWTKTMISFVRQMKKLRMMKMCCTTIDSRPERVNLTRLFGSSSSLHYIDLFDGAHAHYLRDSNKIVMLLDGKSRSITTLRPRLK